jgi:V/A-type H+-transporting ATPase subunit A
MSQGVVVKVSGPLVVAKGLPEAKMFDVVRVGREGLIGEVIEVHGEKLSIQVYEETSGIGPGDPVKSTGVPLSVELGPGMLEGIFDGIQRPLNVIADKAGSYITRGIDEPALNREKKWKFLLLLRSPPLMLPLGYQLLPHHQD